jgi:6-pyruvoyl tetrahydropterin synthase/QueD family protein
MFEVTVDDSFAAGHYLRNYKGKCENPHGHNYKVRVTLAGKELDKAGLLLDFKDLREVRGHQMSHQVGALLLRLRDRVPHRRLVQKPVLNEPMGKAAERRAIGAA